MAQNIRTGRKRLGVIDTTWESTSSRSATTCAQQPPRHEQILAGDIEDQASCTGQVGRWHPACGLVAQTESDPIGDALQRIRYVELVFGAYRPLISPDPLGSGLVSD